jgi:hypothetical protein
MKEDLFHIRRWEGRGIRGNLHGVVADFASVKWLTYFSFRIYIKHNHKIMDDPTVKLHANLKDGERTTCIKCSKEYKHEKEFENSKGRCVYCIIADTKNIKDGDTTECTKCAKAFLFKKRFDNSIGRCYECEREEGGLVDCMICSKKDLRTMTQGEMAGCEHCPTVACQDCFPDGCDECRGCGAKSDERYGFVGRWGRGFF